MTHKISYFVLTFGLSGAAACAAFHDGAKRGSDDVAEDDAPEADVDEDPVQEDPVQEDAPVPRGVCTDDLPGSTPVQLAADIQDRTVKVGPCGQLAFTDRDKNLHLLDPTYTRELRELAPGSPVDFSPDGVLFLGNSANNVVLQDLVSGESFSVAGSQSGFLVQDASWDEPSEQPRSVAFVKDELGVGLLRDGKIEGRLGSGDGYVDAWAKRGSRVLQDDRVSGVHVLDFARGSESALDLQLVGGQGEFSGHDVIQLSADGQLLFHVAVEDEPCGDSFCSHSSGTATVLELEQANRKHTLPASAEYELALIDSSPYLALMGPDTLTLIETGGSFAPASHSGYDALAVLPKYGQALAQQRETTGLALIEFGAKGKVTPIAGSSVLQSSPTSYVGVSSAGSAIAFARPPQSCVGGKDDPTGCHPQLWLFEVWTQERGLIQTYYSSQPLEPVWVGEDGSVIIAGDLIRDVPELADQPIRGEYGSHLLGPDGKERKNLPFGLKTVIERERDLLVVATDDTHSTLGLLDPSTGALRELDELDTALLPPEQDYPWFDLYLDHAQKRLVYVKNWHEADFVSRNSLHAVALP